MSTNTSSIKLWVESILKEIPPQQWSTYLTPAILADLPQEQHEAILEVLPQCGANVNRVPGALRVLSMGFNVHIGGSDPHVPYPIDFCVRVNGERAGINLLIKPTDDWFDPMMFYDMPIGPSAEFFNLILHLKKVTKKKLELRDFELLLLKTYRPACPGGYQLGTAGGVFEVDDTEHSVSIRETKEEFRGFTYLGWSPLLSQQLYQAGNIFELQSVGVVLGYFPNKNHIETAREEGVEGWVAINLQQAQSRLDKITECVWEDEEIWTDGKVHHGLLSLLPKLKMVLS
jgi:hypothetical protein